MEEFDFTGYEFGDWVQEKEGYYFVCKFCGCENTGRANQAYCNTKCRYRFNNELNKEKYKNERQVLKALKDLKDVTAHLTSEAIAALQKRQFKE